MIPPPADPADAGPLGVARVVSRGLHKLQHALHTFGVDPAGLACVDLGASVGGFSQCLLACGAGRVVAIDTARGILDYAVRRDARVRVLEGTNALHATPDESADLVVVDLGWTPQRLGVPAGARWLGAHGPHGPHDPHGPPGRIITLIKPHYESGEHLPEPAHAERVAHRVLGELERAGFAVRGVTRSPIAGSRRRGRAAARGAGNAEWLALLAPVGPAGGGGHQAGEAAQPA